MTISDGLAKIKPSITISVQFIKPMKACLYLQRNFAKVGHALAVQLQREYGVTEFCALVGTRSSLEFLQGQTDIKYEQLILDEDIHRDYQKEELDLNFLQQLEKDYGLPNLWPYLTVDRILMHGQLLREYPYSQPQYNHRELMQLIQKAAKAILKFLDDEKPDFIFFSVAGDLSSRLLYAIAQKKGIRIIFGELSRFPDSYMISDDFQRFHWAEERFEKMRAGQIPVNEEKIKEAKKLIADFRANPRPYNFEDFLKNRALNRSRQFKFLLPHRWLAFGRSAWRMVWAYYFAASRRDYTTINPWCYFWDRLKRKTRVLIGYNDLYDPADFSEDYVYFPLNAEPEIFLLLYAPFATDQLAVIKDVAKSLPLHYKLYVKEHTVMYGYRQRKFYRELKKMPNVKLIDPNIPSFDIIARAKLVTTITGTGGWEAQMFGKPSITFGYTFYNNLSTVKYCENRHQLPYFVKDLLENFQSNEEELTLFIAALLEDTVKVNMIQLWYHENSMENILKEIAPLAELVAKRLNLRRTK